LFIGLGFILGQVDRINYRTPKKRIGLNKV